jgi:phospholipid/cholesterol/gamma-HCH transport system ATP-binding protein
MIRAENISMSFGDRKVLTDISAVFEPGKTNLIIGKSGSGKPFFSNASWDCSTLMRERSGITMCFSPVSISGEGKEIRQQMGMLFQGSALFDSMSVEDNVRFPLDMFTSMSYPEENSKGSTSVLTG